MKKIEIHLPLRGDACAVFACHDLTQEFRGRYNGGLAAVFYETDDGFDLGQHTSRMEMSLGCVMGVSSRFGNLSTLSRNISQYTSPLA